MANLASYIHLTPVAPDAYLEAESCKSKSQSDEKAFENKERVSSYKIDKLPVR